ncbi:MAG: MFS transporter [Phycisphaeraceae bacterium]
MKPLPRKSSAAVLFGTYVAMEVVFVAVVVSGSTLLAVFELSRTQLGLCLGAAQFGGLVASLLIGPVTHRHGPLWTVTVALLGLLLALVTVIAARDFPTLFAGLALAGVCAAAVHNGGVTLLSGVFPGNVRRVMAFASSLWFGASVLTAPLIGAWLDLMAAYDARAWGYRAPLLVTFVLLVLCLGLVRWRLRWVRVMHRRERRGPASPARRPLWRRALPDASWQWLWILAMAVCHGLMLVSLMAWASPMAQATFHVSELMGSAMFAITALGLASGRLLLAANPLPIEDQRLLVISGSVGGLLLAAALLVPGYWPTFALLGLGMLTSSATAPCLFALVAARFAPVRAHVYGYMEAGIASGAMLGAFLVGFMADHGVALPLAMLLSPAAAVTLGMLSLAWRLTTPGGGSHAIAIAPPAQ